MLKWKKQLIENGGKEKLYTVGSKCGRVILQKLVLKGEKKDHVAWGLYIDGVAYDDAENLQRAKLRAEGVVELVDKGEIMLQPPKRTINTNAMLRDLRDLRDDENVSAEIFDATNKLINLLK